MAHSKFHMNCDSYMIMGLLLSLLALISGPSTETEQPISPLAVWHFQAVSRYRNT